MAFGTLFTVVTPLVTAVLGAITSPILGLYGIKNYFRTRMLIGTCGICLIGYGLYSGSDAWTVAGVSAISYVVGGFGGSIVVILTTLLFSVFDVFISPFLRALGRGW